MLDCQLRPNRLSDQSPIGSVHRVNDWQDRTSVFTPTGTPLLQAVGMVRSSSGSSLRVGSCAPFRGHEHPAQGLAYSPRRRTFTSSGEDGSIKLWAVVTRKSVLTLSRHSEFVLSVAFSPDGGELVTAGDTTLRIWDATPLTPELWPGSISIRQV